MGYYIINLILDKALLDRHADKILEILDNIERKFPVTVIPSGFSFVNILCKKNKLEKYKDAFDYIFNEKEPEYFKFKNYILNICDKPKKIDNSFITINADSINKYDEIVLSSEDSETVCVSSAEDFYEIINEKIQEKKEKMNKNLLKLLNEIREETKDTEDTFEYVSDNLKKKLIKEDKYHSLVFFVLYRLIEAEQNDNSYRMLLHDLFKNLNLEYGEMQVIGLLELHNRIKRNKNSFNKFKTDYRICKGLYLDGKKIFYSLLEEYEISEILNPVFNDILNKDEKITKYNKCFEFLFKNFFTED